MSYWQRLLRAVTLFRGQRKALLTASAAVVVTAACEPLIPALLKPLLDRGFQDGTVQLWTVPVFILGLFAVRGLAHFLAQYSLAYAANNAMRGGGGVDGAIHRAGGPRILQDCIARFPNGLATGDAGWTTGGDLPARWVIHTVGPNRSAGQTDRRLLESCYRRALEVADELGARNVAFPLISAGIYGWPKEDAIRVAIDTLAKAHTRVSAVDIVAFDRATHAAVQRQLDTTPAPPEGS